MPRKKGQNPGLWKKNIERNEKRKGQEYTNPKGVTKKNMVKTEFEELERCENKCGRQCESFADHQKYLIGGGITTGDIFPKNGRGNLSEA